MSDSDEEFFLPTQLPPQVPRNRLNEGVSVEKVVKKSVVEYFFLVVFNWNLMVGNPFELHVWEVIPDFPEEWILGPLTYDNRLQKLPINAFGGSQYSLFCKVEKGICIYLHIY